MDDLKTTFETSYSVVGFILILFSIPVFIQLILDQQLIVVLDKQVLDEY